MVQDISANAAQNRPTDSSMTSTPHDDEISFMLMSCFHDGFSRVPLQMFELVVDLKT